MCLDQAKKTWNDSASRTFCLTISSLKKRWLLYSIGESPTTFNASRLFRSFADCNLLRYFWSIIFSFVQIINEYTILVFTTSCELGFCIYCDNKMTSIHCVIAICFITRAFIRSIFRKGKPEISRVNELISYKLGLASRV